MLVDVGVVAALLLVLRLEELGLGLSTAAAVVGVGVVVWLPDGLDKVTLDCRASGDCVPEDTVKDTPDVGTDRGSVEGTGWHLGVQQERIVSCIQRWHTMCCILRWQGTFVTAVYRANTLFVSQLFSRNRWPTANIHYKQNFTCLSIFGTTAIALFLSKPPPPLPPPLKLQQILEQTPISTSINDVSQFMYIQHT